MIRHGDLSVDGKGECLIKEDGVKSLELVEIFDANPLQLDRHIIGPKVIRNINILQ